MKDNYNKFMKFLQDLKNPVEVTDVKEFLKITNDTQPTYIVSEYHHSIHTGMHTKLTVHCPCCGKHEHDCWDEDHARKLAKQAYNAVPAKGKKKVVVTFEFPETEIEYKK